MVGWKLSLVQALAMVAAWFGSLFGSISVEAAVDSLDWPWYIHAGISLGFFVVAYGYVVLHNRRERQPRVSHNGREVAEKIRRIPKRRTEGAEALYQAYTNLAPELKQFPEQADYGYWAWLNEHWPDRAVRFARDALHLSLYDAWKERAIYTGIRYARSRSPWWKRVWARLKW